KSVTRRGARMITWHSSPDCGKPKYKSLTSRLFKHLKGLRLQKPSNLRSVEAMITCSRRRSRRASSTTDESKTDLCMKPSFRLRKKEASTDYLHRRMV